jgi:hypothetical protein
LNSRQIPLLHKDDRILQTHKGAHKSFLVLYCALRCLELLERDALFE